MFNNKEINFVYLSELLQSDKRFADTCLQLIQILNKHSIDYGLLKSTKDIWCRDYMPIQVEKEQFVQFRYEPSYLKGYLNLQSDPRIVCKANKINPQFSKINLDGGNVVNWNNRAIVSDRIFVENPDYRSKSKLVGEIEKLLNVEVIIIPQINSDMTGHADGMVRLVNQNTILGNNREQEFKYWKNRINKALKEYKLDYIDIPFFEHKDKKHKYNALGCYVNYLEIGNLIILPVFEIEGNMDNEVFELFKAIFPDRIIETINYNEIGLYGGLLNCTTWTINQ